MRQDHHLASSSASLIEGLVSVGRALASPAPLAARLEHLCGVVAGLIGCDRSSVFVLDGKTYRGMANFGNPPDIAALFPKHRVSQRDPLIAEAAKSGSVVVVNDALNSDLMNRKTSELAHIKAIAVAPISSRDGATIGFLTAEYHQNPGLFDDVTSRLVLGFASLAAGAIEIDQAGRERSIAQERVVESEHRLAESQRVAGIGSWTVELPGLGLTWSDETYRVYGVSPESFVPSQEALVELIHPDDRAAMEEWTRAGLAGENPPVLEFRAIRPDGSIRIISGRGELEMDGAKPVRMIGTAQDVTERKQAEDALRLTTTSLEQAQAQAHLGSWELDLATQSAEWSAEMFRIYGLDPAGPAPTLSQFFKLMLREDTDRLVEASRRAMEQDEPIEAEFRTAPVYGETRYLLATFGRALDATGQVTRLTGTVQDITDRKLAADRIRRLGQLYATLSECNKAIVRCASEDELLPQLCRAAVDLGGMTMAWIGLVDEATRRVTPAASYGQGLEYLEGIEVSVDAESRFGRGPNGIAIRGNLPYWCDDFQSDPALATWHERASRFGFRASAALPLRRDGVPIGSLNLYAGTVNAFDVDARALWLEVADDTSFALDNLAREARRKQAEAAREESEHKLRLHLQKTPVAVIEWDTAFHVTSWNLAAERIFGYSAAEAMDQHASFIIPEATRPIVDAIFAELLRHSGGERSTNENVTKHGRVVVCDWFNTPLTSVDGTVVGVASLVQDITERKAAEDALRESEERYRLLFDQSPYAIAVYQDGRIVSANPSAWSQMGAAGEDELIGLPISAVVHPDRWEAAQERIRRMLQGETGIYPVEDRFVRLDGTEVQVETTSAPCLYRGRPAIQVIALDITGRKRLEAELLQSQKMEGVGQLAGGIAHDFNNLLNVITGSAFLVSEQLAVDDPLREDLDAIAQAAGRAATMTRQLLAFSRQQIMQPKVLDLGALVLDLEGMLRRLIGEDVDLAVVAARGSGGIRADPGQIEQALVNLAVNARDAMPTGGALTITLHAVDLDEAQAAALPPMQPGPHVMLTVSDTGTGIDEETRVRIFEPFFTTKQVGKGTGLGLSTVYGIVQQSGGAIRVDSEVGTGTSFRIWFPQVDEEAHPQQAAPQVAPQRGAETILVVEDYEGLRVLARRMLEKAGYTVLLAAGGNEAMRILDGHDGPVHLVLTDVVMPGMGGRDLAARIMEVRPEIRVIYTSGYTNDALLRHGIDTDVAHFLSKPYTQEDLTQTVRAVLDADREAS